MRVALNDDAFQVVISNEKYEELCSQREASTVDWLLLELGIQIKYKTNTSCGLLDGVSEGTWESQEDQKHFGWRIYINNNSRALVDNAPDARLMAASKTVTEKLCEVVGWLDTPHRLTKKPAKLLRDEIYEILNPS